MKRTSSVDLDWRAKARERQRALRYFAKLTTDERHELGDALVLGDFDWMDWFDERPTLVFLRALDDARIHWEMTTS